jgi:hypothetical protein
MVNLKYGYVDKNGKLSIPQDYYLAYPFNGEVAAVMPSGKNTFRLINKKGEEIYSQDIFFVARWSEGFMTFNVDGAKDQRGNIVGGSWGMVKEDGKVVVEPQYDFAYFMSEGMLVVQKGGKWGYVNAEGKLAIPCEYDYAGDFKGGRAVVSQGGRDGFINKDGSWFMEPQFECADSFSQTEKSFPKASWRRTRTAKAWQWQKEATKSSLW